MLRKQAAEKSLRVDTKIVTHQKSTKSTIPTLFALYLNTRRACILLVFRFGLCLVDDSVVISSGICVLRI